MCRNTGGQHIVWLQLAEFCRTNLGNVTFIEAYRLTGRVINITLGASQYHSGAPPLLNFLVCWVPLFNCGKIPSKLRACVADGPERAALVGRVRVMRAGWIVRGCGSVWQGHDWQHCRDVAH
jgi:hypothetical protein